MPDIINNTRPSDDLAQLGTQDKVVTTNVRGLLTPSSFGYTPEYESYKSFLGSGFSYNPELESIYQDSRALNQSGMANFAKSIPKMFLYAGTTFLDTVMSTAIGLGQGTYQALQGKGFSDGFANGFINNGFSKAMVDIQAWSDKAMPVYMTSKERDTNPFARAFGMGGGRAFLNF
jgi:hypothetical protein